MKVGYVRVLRFVCICGHHTRKYAIKTPFLPTFIPKRKFLSVLLVYKQSERFSFQLPAHRPPPPPTLEHITKICEDNLGHGTSCWCWWYNLFPSSSRFRAFCGKIKFSRLEFRFSRLFFRSFRASIDGPLIPQRILKIWCLMWNHVFVMSSQTRWVWIALR